MTTYVWLGTDGTNWNDPKNWGSVDSNNVITPQGSNGNVPGSSDTVIITDKQTLTSGGYRVAGHTNDQNYLNNSNIINNLTPTVSGTQTVSVGNVVLGGNNVSLNTGSTPFVVTGKVEDVADYGISGAQHGNYTLSGTDISVYHYVFASSGGTIILGQNSKITVAWLSGSGTNISGNNSSVTITQGYESTDGTKAGATFANGHNGINNLGVDRDQAKPQKIACFLAGSMILTTQGVVAVEDLQMGDEVLAFDWQRGEDVVRPLVWVGKAHAVVRPHLPDDEAGYPVRILKNALADGVPFKDMLITAEHCLFFEDKFIPARMLVNGSSIFYDKSILSYDYYHVETAEHSVLTADGMLTESYLDTGNRAAFRQTGKVVTLSAQPRSWENNAAAPLCVARSVVEGLFRQIRARTSKVENARKADGKTTLVHNPELHLVTESGAVIMPMRHEGARYSFMLPPDITAVRLVSRAARPSDVIGPFVDDRRQLGVAVSDIRLVAGRKLTLIKTHLDAQKPEGWYDAGQEDLAWTNGNAFLPLGKMQKGTMGLLSIDVLAAGPYIAETQLQSDVTLSA
ncbi:hypothetical protein HK13_08360 [Acetobacter indonesiensis]|uniref:Hint domain-containing protein n=1 Tax=Acetobacter indonesiensis TaxID=104101 RepID=UPI000A39832C|nr:Hint domain-containing protein [Acetobacter indonesiensis]OUI93077.1 hypothetical protein HK13_08360 [Acetobacter indonesiensis]